MLRQGSHLTLHVKRLAGVVSSILFGHLRHEVSLELSYNLIGHELFKVDGVGPVDNRLSID